MSEQRPPLSKKVPEKAMRASWALGVGLVVLGAAALAVGAFAPGAPRGVVAAFTPAPIDAAPATDGGFAVVGAKQRGVALGLFAEDVSFDYRPLLAEIAALGATHVALIVPLYQQDGASTKLGLHTRFSPTLIQVAETVRAARRANLEVTLFPIVRLSAPRAGEWRGTLRPTDVDEWFESYADLMGDMAALAASTEASRLVVGSELSSLDGDVPRWTALLEKLRRLFPGRLLYSANWDHYKEAKVLDLVDEVGVTGYFDLRARADGPGDVVAMTGRWQTLRAELEAWGRTRASRFSQPFVFTELGYRSRVGASATPWDETPGGAVDLEDQRRAFEAFRRAWTGARSLGGLYIWNWYGFGGPRSVGYTPRGKPAAEEVKRLLKDM